MTKLLNDKEERILNKFSNKYNKSKDELTEELKDIIKNEQDSYPEDSIDRLRERAILILRDRYSGRKRSKATLQEGFFIGDTGAYDINQALRTKAKLIIQENFKEARLEGLVSEDGTILDNRPTIAGRKNPGFNQPLKTLYRRRIYGIFKNPNYEFGFLNLNGERALNTIVEYFTPCEFLAIDKGMDSGYLTLNQSKFTEFKEKEEDIDVYKIMTNAMKDYKANWNGLEKSYEATKDAWDGVSLIEGFVRPGINIKENVTVLTLVPPGNEEPLEDESLTCFIPRIWDIDFGEWSKLLIFGKLRKRKPRTFGTQSPDEDEDLGYTMNVYGLYITDKIVPKDVKELSREDIKCVWHKKEESK